VIKVNISYELLIYQDNTAVTLKMQNTILKESRKVYICITQLLRQTRISTYRVISL